MLLLPQFWSNFTEIFVNTVVSTIWGWKFQNTTPTVFIRCQPNFMRTLVTMGEYGLLLFLAIGQVLNFVALWNFKMRVNGKTKCEIPWKRLIIERNGRKFGTRASTVHICRVLLMPDSLSLVRGHLVHFAKFPILRFSKRCLSNNFHRIPLEILTLGSMGKPKMWNIPKTADHRAKRKLWHIWKFS